MQCWYFYIFLYLCLFLLYYFAMLFCNAILIVISTVYPIFNQFSFTTTLEKLRCYHWFQVMSYCKIFECTISCLSCCLERSISLRDQESRVLEISSALTANKIITQLRLLVVQSKRRTLKKYVPK